MLRPFLWSMALGDVVDVAAAVALAPTPITKKLQPTIIQRDEKVKTITLGDMNQYGNYDGNDKVDKRDIAIFPTGVVTKIPDSGIHVVFGPEMQQDMGKVVQEKCQDPDQMSDCQKQLYDLIKDSSIRMHTKRIIPVIAVYAAAEILSLVTAAIVGAIAGALLGTGVNAVVGSVNYEDTSREGALSQIQNLAGATAIAIATGADNKVMATVSVPNTPSQATHKPEEAVRITTIVQDDGNIKKGDVLIEIPESTAKRLKEFLAVIGLENARAECKSSKGGSRTTRTLGKRTPPSLSERCADLLRQLGSSTLEELQNGALQAMNPANPDNPMNPNHHPEGAMVPNIVIGGTLMTFQIFRQYLGRHTNLDASAIARLFMNAAAVTEIIANHVLQDPTVQQNIESIILENEESLRKKPEDADCQQNLVCLEENCLGTAEVAGETWQYPYCLKHEVYGCPCVQVEQPIVSYIDENYFETLNRWTQQVMGSGASCDPVNKIGVSDGKAFEQHIQSACKDHNELKRLKKRDRDDWWWSDAGTNDVQWSFNWTDKGDKCDMKCEDIFRTFSEDSTCTWNGGMSGSGSVETNCGTASFSVDKPDPPDCFYWPYYGAPRGRKEVDEEGGRGTSVDEAIEQFCNDIDGKKVTKQDGKRDIARRWGFSEYRVPNRNSFWLRAEYSPYPHCEKSGEEFVRKKNCKAAFNQGTAKCSVAKGSPKRTMGFKTRGLGCINYSIHVTGNMRDDSPPWKMPVPYFPPPFNAQKPGGGIQGVGCYKGPEHGRPITKVDREIAIAAFCKDSVKIVGYGTRDKSLMFDWPPKAQVPYYKDEAIQMFLTTGAQTVNQGAPKPYVNMDNCYGYDWSLGKDDCTYALRRLYETCSPPGRFEGGVFTYRCVEYRSYYINFRTRDGDHRSG